MENPRTDHNDQGQIAIPRLIEILEILENGLKRSHIVRQRKFQSPHGHLLRSKEKDWIAHPLQSEDWLE